MDYDFEAGPEDDVMRRESARAWERYKDPGGDMWRAIAPLVRALLALLAALGAKTLREALERAANPVRAAIDEDDRKTAERWAAHAYATTDPSEEQIAAMLPLVREARQARADALAEHSGAGWAVVAQIGKVLGLAEDASTQVILDAVSRWAAPVDVDVEVEAAIPSHVTTASLRAGYAAALRPLVEQRARLQRELQGCEATASDLAEQLVEARAEIERLSEQWKAAVAAGEKIAQDYRAQRDEAQREVEGLKSDLDSLARDVGQALVAATLRPGERLTEQRPHAVVRTVVRLVAEKHTQAAELARLKSAPGEAWERLRKAAGAVCYVGPDDGSLALKINRLRVAHDAVEQAAPRPALTEEDATWWARCIRHPEHPQAWPVRLVPQMAQALMRAWQHDIPAEVRAGVPTPKMAVTTGEDAPDSVDPVDLSGDGPPCPWCGSEQHDGATHMRTGEHAPKRDADDPPDSVDPRDLPPDSEEWVERAPGLSVHRPRPDACNVDHSGDRRPEVLSSECPECLHWAPLHEATCTRARCDGHGQAPERPCVAVLATDSANRVLLVHSSKPGRGWELPGGKVRDGEMLSHAAAREVKEEAGLEAVIFLDGKTELRTAHVVVFRGNAAGEPTPGSDAVEAEWLGAEDVLAMARPAPGDPFDIGLSDLASRAVLLAWAREQVASPVPPVESALYTGQVDR